MPPPKFTSRNYFNAAQEHPGLARQAFSSRSRNILSRIILPGLPLRKYFAP